jgi:hypothetical protein
MGQLKSFDRLLCLFIKSAVSLTPGKTFFK